MWTNPATTCHLRSYTVLLNYHALNTPHPAIMHKVDMQWPLPYPLVQLHFAQVPSTIFHHRGLYVTLVWSTFRGNTRCLGSRWPLYIHSISKLIPILLISINEGLRSDPWDQNKNIFIFNLQINLESMWHSEKRLHTDLTGKIWLYKLSHSKYWCYDIHVIISSCCGN